MSCPASMTFAHHAAFRDVAGCDLRANHADEIREEINFLRKSQSPWDHKRADGLALDPAKEIGR